MTKEGQVQFALNAGTKECSYGKQTQAEQEQVAQGC